MNELFRRSFFQLLFWMGLLAPNAETFSNQDSSGPPLRHPANGNMLSEIADQFGLEVDYLRVLNPPPEEGRTEYLLVSHPRSAEEATELLETARRAETRGGEFIPKAVLIYTGILETARLLDPQTKGSRTPPDVEIHSRTVGEALLGWARLMEARDVEKARWAYERIQAFFPDMPDLFDEAESRLAALQNPGPSSDSDESAEKPDRFDPPHLAVEIDVPRLLDWMRRKGWGQTFRTLNSSDHAELARWFKNVRKKESETIRILESVQKVTISGWLRTAPIKGNQKEIQPDVEWLVRGDLGISAGEWAEAVNLPEPRKIGSEMEASPVGDGRFLHLRGNTAYLAKREVLEQLEARIASQQYYVQAGEGSPFSRMKEKVGMSGTLYGFIDLEGLLAGPAVEMVERAPIRDPGELVVPLLVSGAVGVTRAEGLAFSVEPRGDDLNLILALAHQEKGPLYHLAGETCENRMARFLPEKVDGAALLQITCGPIAERMGDILNENPLGPVAKIYQAAFERFSGELAGEAGLPFHLTPLLENGLLSEAAVGFYIPEGIIPLPNVILATPLGDASDEIQAIEEALEKQTGFDFEKEEENGHWYRHSVAPIEAPLFVDLSYTLLDGVLLVSNHPSLISKAIAGYKEDRNLLSNHDFQERSPFSSQPGHLEVFLSRDFSRKLARWGRARVSSELRGDDRQPVRETAEIHLRRMVHHPETSAAQLAFHPDRLQLSIEIGGFRHILTGLISLHIGEKLSSGAYRVSSGESF